MTLGTRTFASRRKLDDFARRCMSERRLSLEARYRQHGSPSCRRRTQADVARCRYLWPEARDFHYTGTHRHRSEIAP